MGEQFGNLQSRLGVTDSQVAEFCSRWGLVGFALFGSVLGPDFRPDSDVDVLIRYRPDRVPRLGDLVDMREDLEILFGRAVDLVTSGVIDAAPTERFSRAVMGSRRVLYAA